MICRRKLVYLENTKHKISSDVKNKNFRNLQLTRKEKLSGFLYSGPVWRKGKIIMFRIVYSTFETALSRNK